MRKSTSDTSIDWFWNRLLLPIRIVYHHLAWFLFYLFYRLKYKLRIYGRENIPKKGCFIVAPNHESHLDPPLIGVVFIRPLRYFAKIELFKYPVFSMLIRSMGAVPISPNPRDLKRLFRWTKYFADTKQPFVIFPEGRRTKDGELQPGRPGIGFIVQQTRLPVVPVYIDGTFEALPIGSSWLSPSRITVRIGSPIDFVSKLNIEPSNKMDKELAQQISNQIMEEIKRLKEETDESSV